MKNTITCLLLTVTLWSGAGYAAQPQPAKQTGEVQKDLDSIVSSCEKKRLPTEKEIECIEKGYLQFMGEEPAEEERTDSQNAVKANKK